MVHYVPRCSFAAVVKVSTVSAEEWDCNGQKGKIERLTENFDKAKDELDTLKEEHAKEREERAKEMNDVKQQLSELKQTVAETSKCCKNQSQVTPKVKH